MSGTVPAGVNAVRPERCSRLSATVGEPPGGTAPVAAAWIALEQPGPWGREAATESHLDPVLGGELARRATAAGARLALIRRPGRHSEPAGTRTVLLAGVLPGRSTLYRAELGDPRDLLEVDVAALVAGRAPGLGAPEPGPVLMVCTNARRDACCALYGRPLAREVAARYPGHVWEASHLGGHRFAPTALLLPGGYAYARLTGTSAGQVMEAARAGRLHLPGLRGRTGLPAPAQVAEVAVRAALGEDDPEALRPGDAGDAGDGVVPVEHVDGRAWRVRVATAGHAVVRPESCGKPVKPLAFPEARSVERVR